MRSRVSIQGSLAFLTALLTGTCLAACGEATVVGEASGSCSASFATVPSTAVDVTLDNSTNEFGQSFRLTSAGNPGRLQLKLKGIGSPAGNLIVKIEGSSASGVPDDITLATATLDASTIVSTAAAYYAFTFTTPPTLSANVTYWIRLKGSSLSATNAVQWLSNHDGAYADGAASFFSSGFWSSGVLGADRDFHFLLGC